MPLKNPNLVDIHANIDKQVYEWMRGRIKEGRYATLTEIVRQALFELKEKRESTLVSYG